MSITIEIDGMPWTIDVADLLMWLLIGALALGAVLWTIAAVMAWWQGRDDRRAHREWVREIRQRTDERKARDAAPPEQEPEAETGDDYAAQVVKRRTAVEVARRRRLWLEGMAEAGTGEWVQRRLGLIPVSQRYDASRPGEIQGRTGRVTDYPDWRQRAVERARMWELRQAAQRREMRQPADGGT